ncbi:hypothetical protein C0991_009392 [Blastosporella zonata]|nr:hypothetical protein C0991_009392 [Blastosporella zonata]
MAHARGGATYASGMSPIAGRLFFPTADDHIQTLLGLWGMPIGEFFDLEKLSAKCAETGRYTFFFSSWPLNIIGGCASPPNAAAYF